MRLPWRAITALSMLVAVGGCGGERLASGAPPAAAPVRTPPPVDMAGRWMFSAAGGGCAMNFGGAQGAEGAIRPEGGCPGQFYTSRKWTFESGTLVMRDHTGKALAQLSLSTPGRFDGQGPNGQPLSLTR